MVNTRISIDNLIEIVRTGGKIQTGVDVYNDNGILLLDKDVLVEKVKILEIIKKSGINSVPVSTVSNGGLWDDSGNLIKVGNDGLVDLESSDDKTIAEPVIAAPETGGAVPDLVTNEIEKRLQEIEKIKKEASQKFT